MKKADIFSSINELHLLHPADSLNHLRSAEYQKERSQHFPYGVDPEAAIKAEMTETLFKEVMSNAPKDEGIVALVRNRNDRIMGAGKVGVIAALKYRGRMGAYSYATLETTAVIDYFQLKT